MAKKISVGLTVFLIILTAALTFELTVVFGDVFFRSSPVGKVPASYTTAADPAPEEPSEQTFAEKVTARAADKIARLLSLYERYYVGELDEDLLVDGVCAGIVAYSGDRYGAYHDAKDMEELNSSYAGEFTGIGISVVYDAEMGALEILSVMPNTPAEENKLLPGDYIIGVEGADVLEIGYAEAIARIRGQDNTPVTLKIARGEPVETFDLTLTRRKVEEQSVDYEKLSVQGLSAPLAYIRLMDFNDKTAEQFIEALRQSNADRVHGVIIDVRDNGGGELKSIVTVLDALLPAGPIVRIRDKDGKEEIYNSDQTSFDRPMIVLCNSRTASAAELFVSALKDYNKAVIVGTTTYGKGTVQSIIDLGDGPSLRLSTALYLPPYSDNFEGIGVTPDIEVEIDEEYRNVNLYKVPHDKDAQLQAAIAQYK